MYGPDYSPIPQINPSDLAEEDRVCEGINIWAVVRLAEIDCGSPNCNEVHPGWMMCTKIPGELEPRFEVWPWQSSVWKTCFQPDYLDEYNRIGHQYYEQELWLFEDDDEPDMIRFIDCYSRARLAYFSTAEIGNPLMN